METPIWAELVHGGGQTSSLLLLPCPWSPGTFVEMKNAFYNVAAD